jgi:hypothetical protein
MMDDIDISGDGGVRKRILRKAKEGAAQPSSAEPVVDGELPQGLYPSILWELKPGWMLDPLLYFLNTNLQNSKCTYIQWLLRRLSQNAQQ